MEPIYPPEKTQAGKILKVLLDAKGEWINFQYFVRTLYMTQAHAIIWKLENQYHWKIEHSEFSDEYGFKSYRISVDKQPELIHSSIIDNSDRSA